MKPNFALNLSHEGIVLLHRSPTRAWLVVGEVALDDPSLRENLSFLRSTAIGLDGKNFGTKLIIPNSQILYREVEAPGPEPEVRTAQIAAALDGQLPYPMEELAFDWRDEGGHLMVAIVARETLEEAESFAVEHRFNPISFVAVENDDKDAWEPFFGRTDYSYAILDADVDVRDAPVAMAAATIFAEDIGTDDPEAEDTEADENFFAEVEDTASQEQANIFAEQDDFENETDEVESETEEVPQSVTPEVASKTDGSAEFPDPDEKSQQEVEPAPFASRRTIMTVSGGDMASRPLNRLAPRIALKDVSDTDTVESPTISDQDKLRAEMMEAEHKSPSTLRKLVEKIAPLAAATALSTKTKTVSAAKTVAKATGKAAKTGTALGRRALAAASSFKLPSIGRKKTEAGPDLLQQTQPEIAEAAIDPQIEPTEAPLAGSLEAAFANPMEPERKDRKPLIAAALGGIVLLLGALWLVLPGDDPDDIAGGSDPTQIENAALTTSPERGVRLENRARARPSDFASTVASAQGDTTVVNPERPARRALLEPDEDPDFGKPDTAEIVEDLSEEELADIRRAGAPLPTAEEIAEEGDEGSDTLFTEEEIATLYAQTGILQELRGLARPGADQDRDDIFVAQADRDLEANDAIILPDFNTGVQDDPPRRLMSPLSPGIAFDVDERGFVKPTAEGAINPDGILIRAGRPDVRPPEKPAREELVPPNPLAALTPKARPVDLKTGEDAIFVQGKMTLAELRNRRAKARPDSVQAAEISTDSTPTELAILSSFQPQKRPSDFADKVEKTRTQLASVAPATGDIERDVDSGLVLPTRASVAKQATIRNAINLSKINLIGVYGSPSKRSALLRLPSGRYVKVKIGDRIDGGRVAAISTNTLSYVKSGRNRVLKVPN